MKRIRVLTSVAGLDFTFAPGQVAEVPDDQAAAMIACGQAEAASASASSSSPKTTTAQRAGAALDAATKRDRPRGRKGK